MHINDAGEFATWFWPSFVVHDDLIFGIYPDPRTAFDDKQDAMAFLRDLTEEDFGHDTAKWRAWFDSCSREMLDLYWDEYAIKVTARKKKNSDGNDT